jgi:H+-translocating NAD(P) transhydrogenase subunit beta
MNQPKVAKKLPTGETVEEQEAQYTTVEALADALVGAERVVVVPGYGLAVANAQSAIAEVYSLLRDHGVEV